MPQRGSYKPPAEPVVMTFLATGDVVDQPVYSPEGLTEANHSFGKFDIAVLIAKALKAERQS